MSQSADPAREAIVLEFLEELAADRLSGRQRSIAEYQALFPGHEATIARAFGEATAAGTTSVLFPAQGTAPTLAEEAGAAARPGTIRNQYRITGILGRGGQATVYLAEDLNLSRPVALKILHGPASSGSDALRRFKREAEVTSRLAHPGVCPIYDVGVEGGVAWIAMRPVEGELLSTRIARKKERVQDDAGKKGRKCSTTASDIEEAVRIIEAAARAAHAAHEAGIVHRDLKPGNIIITPDGQPVLLDFGLARDDRAEGLGLTETGEVFGTPHYISPEQLNGQPADRRSDIFALGVTLFEYLTLSRPFDAPTRALLADAILTGPIPDCRKLNRQIPEDLKIVLETALERDSARRYQTALDLAEDLRRVRSREPIHARPVSSRTRLLRWAERSPARTALVLFLSLGVPAFTAVLGYLIARLPLIRAAEAREAAEVIEQEVEKGFIHFIEGRLEEALSAFDRTLRLDENTVEAIAGAALTLHRLGRDSEALKLLDRHPVEGDGAAGILTLRIGILRALKRTAEAEAYGEVPGGSSRASLDWFLLAVRELRHGESGETEAHRRALASIEKAIATSRRARAIYQIAKADAAAHIKAATAAEQAALALTTLWPDSPNAWFYAGLALKATGKLSEALRCYARAVDRSPKFQLARFNLGNALRESGDLPGAIREYRMAVALDPRDIFARVNLGTALLESGDRPAGLSVLTEAAAEKRDDPSVHAALATALAETDDTERAIAHARRAAEIAPSLGIAQDVLCVIYRRIGKTDLAIEHGLRALALEPANATFALNLGAAHLRGGDLDEAEKAVRRALEIEPDLGIAVMNLAVIEARRGRIDESLVHFRRAVELAPLRVDAHRNLMLALKSAKLSLELETREAKRWAELHPDDGEVWLELADLALRLERRPDQEERGLALSAAKRAVEIFGGRDPRALRLLALASVEAGDFEAAEAALLEAKELPLPESAPAGSLATSIDDLIETVRRRRARVSVTESREE